MSFFADGHTLAVGTLMGNIELYDLRAVQNKIMLSGHEGSPINCVDFVKSKTRDVRPSIRSNSEDETKSIANVNRFKTIEDIRNSARNRAE